MALVPLNDHYKTIENLTVRVSFSIILNDHLIRLVAMVYPVINRDHHSSITQRKEFLTIIYYTKDEERSFSALILKLLQLSI